MRKVLGLSDEQFLDPDTRISIEQADYLLRKAIATSGRRDLGLLAAEQIEPGDLDIVEFTARSRSTLEEGGKCINRFLPLLNQCAEITMSRHGDTMRWTYGFKAGITMHEAASEFVLALVLICCRRATGVTALAQEVWFAHEQPPDISTHQRIFGCPIRFEAPSYSLLIPSTLGQLPLLKADSKLSSALHRVAENMLARLPKPTGLHERVRELILEQLANGHCSAETVADRLQISTRTLNRKLREKGTSFRVLADETRHQLALNYLKRQRLAINEVAYLLGFSSPQAFHRAFKRWTGTTPVAYRRTG